MVVKTLRCNLVQLAQGFQRQNGRCCGTNESSKATGTRLTTTSAGIFDPGFQLGSNALQCGCSYQKNSITSDLAWQLPPAPACLA